MSISEKAVEYHCNNCNCAQSVLCACSAYTGLDDETAKRIAAGFGGGVRCGEICGAISGAVMAIGAASEDGNGKPAGEVAALTKQMTAAFKEKYGYVRCFDLLRDAKQKRCDEFIGYCAEQAEQIIQKKAK